MMNGYWNNIKRDREEACRMMDWVGEQLSIKSLDDWYRISLHQIRRVTPLSWLTTNKMLADMLMLVYPRHKWDVTKLCKDGTWGGTSKTTQREVAVAVRKLLPKAGSLFSAVGSLWKAVHEDYQHPNLFFSSGKQMELDVFVPQYSLAVEYQGEHHFKNVYAIGEQRSVAERDKEKRLGCYKVNWP